MARSRTISYFRICANDEGREQASMGQKTKFGGVGDYQSDGKVDFYVTNFSDDYNILIDYKVRLIFGLSFAAGSPNP